MKTGNRKKTGIFTLIFAALLTACIIVNSANAEEDNAVKKLYFTGLDENSVITLFNNEDTEDTATISAYNASGHPVDTEIITVGAEETQDFEIADMSADTRSLIVEFKGSISGSAIISGNTVDAVEKPMSQFEFPAENLSSVFILNPNDTQTDVTLIALDEEGIELERSTVSGLYPMESREVVISSIFRMDTVTNISLMKGECTDEIIVVQVFKQIRKYRSSSSQIKLVYPVDGLPGDFDCPSDADDQNYEAPRQKGKTRTWYSMVWSGKYNGIWQTRCKGSGGHPGVDIRIPSGTAVKAIAPGTVEKSFKDSVWGEMIVIRHDNISGTNGPVWSVYAHLSRRDVEKGTPITTAGQKIGLSGSSGKSDGPHLHFQIDKGNIFLYPYYPSKTETFDKNLSANTYDPIAFINSHSITNSSGSLSGKLHENSSKGPALSGATVTCNGKSTTSSSSGSFTLSGLSTGWQNLKFSKTGYDSYEKGIYITAGKNANAGDVYLVKNPVTGKDNAAFAGENYSDNTSVTGGSTFTKEWKIRNTGSTTWTSAYKLRIYRVSGGRISTVTQAAVSGTVGKNSVHTFRVPMKAPNASTVTKTYREDWVLVGPSGIIPVSGSKTVWVQIRVPASVPPQPTGGGVYGVLHENSATGPLLGGASVTIAGKSAVTGGNGFYSLSGLSTGWQTLRFSKSGYTPYQKGVFITAGKNENAGDNYLVKNAPPQTTPSIIIKNPGSGEEWRSDERKHIQWEYKNFPSRGDVAIYYKIDKDDSKWRTIESATTNDGGRWWEMCDFHTEDSKDAQIMIRSVQYPEAYDIVTFKMDHAKECE